MYLITEQKERKRREGREGEKEKEKKNQFPLVFRTLLQTYCIYIYVCVCVCMCVCVYTRDTLLSKNDTRVSFSALGWGKHVVYGTVKYVITYFIVRVFSVLYAKVK